MASDERIKKLRAVLKNRQLDLKVILEDIHDPHNVNAIYRTCEAVGVMDVMLVYIKQKFPEIKFYMEQTIKFCRKSGYVNNIFGRRSHFLNINDKNYNVRNFQERAAINAPIQGSAADVMRLAMMNLNENIEKNPNYKTKMLLQIHDELVFETPKDELKKIIPMIKKNMSDVSTSKYHKFSIPLTVDINSGNPDLHFKLKFLGNFNLK